MSALPRIYEVQEFAQIQRGEELVTVRHLRTIYHPDGRISHERLSVEPLLEVMIRAFNGYVYRSAGVLTGFFNDPDEAKECAKIIIIYHDKQVEICGTQITIAV